MSRRYIKRSEFNAVVAGLRLLQVQIEAQTVEPGVAEQLDYMLYSNQRIDAHDIDRLIEDMDYEGVQLTISEGE
jgi:hypothetical protein